MRGKILRQRLDAALLRLAAGDPVDRVEGGERLRRRVGIGRLGIVDEEHAACAGRGPPCGARGPESSPWPRGWCRRRGRAPSPRPRPCAAFCQLCRPRRVGRPAKRGFAPLALEKRRSRHRRRASRPCCAPTETVTSCGRLCALQRSCDRLHRPARRCRRSPCRRRPMLAKMRAFALRDSRAMSPWRSRWSGVRFSQTRDIGPEVARQVELVGRHFEHVDAPVAGLLRGRAPRARYCRRPRPEPADGEHMADQRRRRRLAVGAGDRDEARLPLRLAPQQLDVADDLDARAPAPCRRSDAGPGG